tara:strand:+ start:940 stop:2790 length:1851 start_codon:yes stop_codon:yes gene_type:complete
MCNYIIKNYLLLLIVFGPLFGQLNKKKEPKTFLFGLIKFDSESTYESGYWFDRWFRSREFAAPVNFIPIELRYGIGFNGDFSGSVSNPSAKDEKNNIKYEDGSIEQLEQGISNIWGPSIEIDLGLINLPHYLINTTWMNMMTGFTFRRSTLFSPALLPHEAWGNTNANWKGEKKFSPFMNEILLTNVLQWQPFNFWYLNFRYSYGLATTKFYSSDNENWDKSPYGSGTSSAFGLGIRFIIDSGKSNRYTLGIDLRHSYSKINSINDPGDLTPIKNFDLVNYGLYLTISAFYGGKKTIGDRAKRKYFHRDYITARTEFKDFLYKYPSHSNYSRALNYLEICDRKIPYVIMGEGVKFDDLGKTQQALSKYFEAKSLVKNDSVILSALEGRIDQIALDLMNKAEMLLPEERYDEAMTIVRKVAKFSEHGKKALRRFKSYTILGNGKKLQLAGFIGKAMGKYAEALKINGELLYMVKALQYNAGIQMVNLANEADEFDEIFLAIESLKYAKELSGEIGSKNEILLIELEKKLENYDEFKIKLRVEERMNVARKKQTLARSERLELGMSISQIEDLMGKPHEKLVNANYGKINNQLWIYFVSKKTLQLSFQDFLLFKIEEI